MTGYQSITEHKETKNRQLLVSVNWVWVEASSGERHRKGTKSPHSLVPAIFLPWGNDVHPWATKHSIKSLHSFTVSYPFRRPSLSTIPLTASYCPACLHRSLAATFHFPWDYRVRTLLDTWLTLTSWWAGFQQTLKITMCACESHKQWFFSSVTSICQFKSSGLHGITLHRWTGLCVNYNELIWVAI